MRLLLCLSGNNYGASIDLFCNYPLKVLLIQGITVVNIVKNSLISWVRLPKLKNLLILLSIKI